jgi:putative iron-regulated protein
VAAGANHADRRRAALRALAQLLQADLKSVRDDWAPDAAYRRDFAQNPQALRRALTGFTALAGGELAGERLSTALYTQAQEEEQSCFSDTTDRDMQADLRSLDTVWSGRYLALDARTLDGPGLRAAALNIDAALARRMDVQLAAASAAAQALRAPFDQEIVAANPAGRARIARLIEALQQVADTGKALIRANLRRSKQATR